MTFPGSSQAYVCYMSVEIDNLVFPHSRIVFICTNKLYMLCIVIIAYVICQKLYYELVTLQCSCIVCLTCNPIS